MIHFPMALAVLNVIGASPPQTLLQLEASEDGVTWTDRMDLLIGGGTTQSLVVRASVTFQGTEPVLGFGGLTWQPVFENIRPGLDRVLDFASQGNNTNGGSVVLDDTPLDGPFGRVSPFAATGPSGLQRYTLMTHAGGSGGAPPGHFLRIARNDVTRWMGTGPTTGTGAVNNFNGAGGLACVQKTAQIRDPDVDPPFREGSVGVVIAQFGLIVGGRSQDLHTITIDAPIDGLSRNSSSGDRVANWYLNAGSIPARVSVVPCTIRLLVPGPGPLVVLGLALATARRRQRN